MFRRDILFAVVSLLCVAAFVVHSVWHSWVTDDALITFRYVRNFVAGDGLTYNPGERIEGFSNPLYTLLLVPFGLFGADLLTLGQVLGVCFGVAELVMILLLVRRVTGSAWYAAIAGALFASDRIVAVWTTGGLETSMHGALLFAAFALCVHRHDANSRGELGVTALFAAVAISRPEGAAYYAVYLGYLLIADRADRRWIISVRRSLALFAGIVGACVAVRYLYYGAVVANTYHAKVGGVDGWGMGALYLEGFALRMGWASWLLAPWLLLAATLVAALKASDQRQPLQAPTLLTAAAIVGLSLPMVVGMGGDYMTDFRFLRPIMGVLYAAVACALAIAFASKRTWLIAAASLSLAGFAAGHGYRQAKPTPVFSDAPPPADHKKILTVSRARMARFTKAINKVALPGDKLLIDWGGFRGYGHGLYAVDATGLVSRQLKRDFYLRDRFNANGVRERVPGHARWPKVSYMQRVGFTFIFPKVSKRSPLVAEVTKRSPKRHQGYPFLHVVVPLGKGEFLRFFTTLSPQELRERAAATNVGLCYRASFSDLQCARGKPK